MNQIKRWLIWLSRIHRCRGFGIQSPSDYAFVRYVVNEHWPYYAYDELPSGDWLTKKLGQLYFRLANWRQPDRMPTDSWKEWWQAGCRKTHFMKAIDHLELARVDIADVQTFDQLAALSDDRSILVVEGISNDWRRWHAIERDERVGTTFDLYYCGIVFFDTKRYKNHYTINF